MKRFIVILLSVFPFLSYAESAPSFVETKVGYFFFTSSPLKDVYRSGGVDVQLSGGYHVCSWLRLYGSVEYLQKSGHSLGGHQNTSIWEIPLSIGLQSYVMLFHRDHSSNSLAGTLTLGPRVCFAHVHNHSQYVDRTMNENGLGGFANVGINWSVHKNWAFDLFGEYSYCKLNFESSHMGAEGHKVQVGGLVFGGGVIYQF